MVEKKFVESVFDLCRANSEDDAIILVTDTVHTMAESDVLPELDAVFAVLDPDELSEYPMALLSFLSSTVCFRDNLRRRSSFCRAVHGTLERKFGPDTAGRLMENMW